MKKLKLLTFLILMVMVFSSCNSKKITLNDKIEIVKQPDINYDKIEKAYFDFICEKFIPEDYNAIEPLWGMGLYDLDEDFVPELFILTDDGQNHCLLINTYKNGEITDNIDKIILSNEKKDIIKNCTFYENPKNFFSIYRNKISNNLAFISKFYNSDSFSVSTFVNGNLLVENIYGESTDKIMADYTFVEKNLISYFPRTLFEREVAEVTLNEMFEKYEEYKKEKVTYENAKDGEFFCYIKDINKEDKEILLIPMSEISYEDYTKAVENDHLYNLNGEEYSIKHYEDSKYLYSIMDITYPFKEPTKDSPSSLIEYYYDNTPLKAKFKNNTKVQYGVLGYDEKSKPTDYETLGRKKSMNLKDFIEKYEEYSFGGYYKATIKNNKLIKLDVLYKP